MNVQKWLDDRLAFFERERSYLVNRSYWERENGEPADYEATFAKLQENDECIATIKKLKKAAAEAGLGALEETK